jgi:type III restriction enzyme
LQDDVRVVRPTGNIFLTNIHRVYLGDVIEPSLDDDDLRDYFLGLSCPKPVGKTTPASPTWARSCAKSTNCRVQRRGAPHPRPAHGVVQVDPGHPQPDAAERRGAGDAGGCDRHARHNNGAIFVQTVSRLPAGRGHRTERGQAPGAARCRQPRQAASSTRAQITEKYADYLELGVEEWRKSYAEHEKLGKKAVLFVMVDDTKNCDEVAAYLERSAPSCRAPCW